MVSTNENPSKRVRFVNKTIVYDLLITLLCIIHYRERVDGGFEQSWQHLDTARPSTLLLEATKNKASGTEHQGHIRDGGSEFLILVFQSEEFILPQKSTNTGWLLEHACACVCVGVVDIEPERLFHPALGENCGCRQNTDVRLDSPICFLLDRVNSLAFCI